MNSKLRRLLSGQTPPGLYRVSSKLDPHAVISALEAHGWRGFHLDGRQITDKQTFLAAMAQAMHFPDYFGANWDALEECVTDLSWTPARGYVLLYDHVIRFARSRPHEWVMARRILAQAVETWQADDVPFYVLLAGARRAVPDIPWL